MDHFLRSRLIFSLQYATKVGSISGPAIYYKASISFLSAAKSMASLYLPMRCNNRYCSLFCLAGMRAIIFMAQVVSPFFISRSAISSAGILNSFCLFSMKINSSSNFLPSISTFILSRMSRFGSTSYAFLKSSTAPPLPWFMKNSICLPKVMGVGLSVTNRTVGFLLMNWFSPSKLFLKASLRHSICRGDEQLSRYCWAVRRKRCMASYFLEARPILINSMILVSVSCRQSQYLTSRSLLNILQQFISAQMHSMFLENSQKTQQSDSFSEAEMRLIARQSKFSQRDLRAYSILFWQNLWQVYRFSLLPIHNRRGTFLERDGSNSNNFMASSLRPISIDLCAISVKETPFSFCSLLRMLSQISSSDYSVFCTLQQAQSVKILTLKF